MSAATILGHTLRRFKWTEEAAQRCTPMRMELRPHAAACRESEATMIGWLKLCQGPEASVFITDANGMPRADRTFGDYEQNYESTVLHPVEAEFHAITPPGGLRWNVPFVGRSRGRRKRRDWNGKEPFRCTPGPIGWDFIVFRYCLKTVQHRLEARHARSAKSCRSFN